jgi:hypothetical protein
MNIVDSNAKLRLIVDMAMSVLPSELGCEDCFEYFAAYADQQLNGTALPESLRQVAEHLDRCAACMEEMQMLIEAMRAPELAGFSTPGFSR